MCGVIRPAPEDNSDYRRGSISLLGQRIAKVVAVIVAGVLTLSILGFNITTAIARLGIGSIALAFAAQKTLENLLGGVSILGDEVIRISEACRIGQRWRSKTLLFVRPLSYARWHGAFPFPTANWQA
jgi:MscS family membrane protein